jgi:hypothetical protein
MCATRGPLFVVPKDAPVIGSDNSESCDAEFECAHEHHLEYVLVDTSLTCHIDDTDALIADLNAAVKAEEAVRAPAV